MRAGDAARYLQNINRLLDGKDEGAPPAPQAPGLKYYYEVLVPELAELTAIGSRLAEAGIPFERKDEAIEVQDPSGNTLIIRT